MDLCAVVQYLCVWSATSYPSLSLKLFFPPDFSFLLHSCSTVAHFGALKCTDSYHACSLSAIHLVQSVKGSSALTSISSPRGPHPPPLFFHFLSLLLFILASYFLFWLYLNLLICCLFRFYSPTPPSCPSAVSWPGRGPPPSSRPPRNKSEEPNPCTPPILRCFIDAPTPPFASPSSSCCSAFYTCPQPATPGERRAGVEEAATSSLSHSRRPITWPCQTCCAVSASPSS